MNEIKNRNKINKSKAADYQPDKSQVSTKESKIETMKNWLKRFGDKIKGVFNKGEYGQLIILIGQRKTGKSETVKTLCKQISCNKYVVKFDGNLLPTPIPNDDKKDWEKIPNVKIIENTDQLNNQDAGLLIIEDFPALTEEGKNILYNIIKDSRHDEYQANFIIIAHDFSVIKGEIFNQSNAILIYKDAAIKPNHLDPKVGGLKQGWAIKRAKDDIKEFQYIFVSLDLKKWHNQIHIDTRDIDVIKKTLKGKLNSSDLKDINYPKKNIKKTITNRDYKRQKIIQMLKEGKDFETIESEQKTTLNTIYKIKAQEKRNYRKEKGYSKNINDSKYPTWLRDKR